tara:strand:- start:43 stop:1299 length:1257 start_codon:yes stop_codon:yes gene_type:complete
VLAFSSFRAPETGFIVEGKEGKNLHLEHLEDEVLNGGVEGVTMAFKFLDALQEMMNGSAKSSVKITTKWDGAPAIFCGKDPADGQFFVGTKSVFAQNPKLCKTPKDVDEFYSESGLNPKLKIALAKLKDVGIPDGHVFQGDMMFTSEDLTDKTIDGTDYVTFQPNTIVYAIPKNTPLAKQIKGCKVGVVFHTDYSGKGDLAEYRASFNPNVKALKPAKDVWIQDAEYSDASGTAMFTAKESKDFSGMIKLARAVSKKVDKSLIERFASDEKLRVDIKAFMNSKIRQGQRIGNTAKMALELLAYLEEKQMKKIAKLKTQKNIDAKTADLKKFISDLTKQKGKVKIVFDLMNAIQQAKDYIVKKLEKVKQMTDTFVKTETGFKVTGPEGFVAVDKMKGNAVKIVDRLEFSMANFNAIKSW